MKIMVTFFKRSQAPTLQQATADPRLCQRLLGLHRQVWVGLLWGHCSFLLGPGAHKVLFVPAKSLFPQSCGSSGGSMVGLMATSSKRPLPHPGLLHQSPRPWGRPLPTCTSAGRAAAPEPRPCSRPLPTRTSAGGAQTALAQSPWGPWCAQVLLEPSEHFWWVRGLILNAIPPLLPSFWGFSFALGRAASSHSRSSAVQPPLQRLPSCWGFSTTC